MTSYAVFLRNRRWKTGIMRRQKRWTEHPYHFEIPEQAAMWGRSMVRTMSELDEWRIEESDEPVYLPPAKLEKDYML